MSFILSTIFICPSLGLALILLFAVWRFLNREKYAASFLNLPDANRERFIESEKNLVALFKIALWLAPVYLVFVPIVLFFFLQDIFLIATICMVLLFVTILQEYLFRRWLLSNLEIKALPK